MIDSQWQGNKKIWFAIDYDGKQPSFWRYYSHQVRVYRHICILSLQWLHDFHPYSTHAYLMLPSYISYSSTWEKWYGSHSWVLHWLTTLLHSSFDHLPSFVVQISQLVLDMGLATRAGSWLRVAGGGGGGCNVQNCWPTCNPLWPAHNAQGSWQPPTWLTYIACHM